MKVYLVGGAVRDEILERPVKDRDWVVVDATPKDMLDLGYEQVGADFPVFLHPVTREEYALARVERKIGEGYHGFEVSTKDVTIEDDLSRRDLTINSIAKDIETGEYIDPYGGIADIKARVLRHTSDAFAEDPLRVIRFARFAARYTDFTANAETCQLCQDMVNGFKLNELPFERFWAELEKVVHEVGAHRFFTLLDGFDAFTHVTFFREVFGKQPDEHEHWDFVLAMCDASKSISPEKRRDILCAVLARRDKPVEVAGATSDFIKLHRNLITMQQMWDKKLSQPQKIDETYVLMKLVKPWGEGPHYDYLILTSWLLEQGNGPLPYFYSFELELFREKLLNVKSDAFPNLQGKELGAAIEKARKLNLELCL